MATSAEMDVQLPMAAEEQPRNRILNNGIAPIPQYSLRKILLVWAAAAIPMALLGWVVAPAVASDPQKPGFERPAVLTAGLAWQFVLVMILLYQETGTLRWSVVRQRLWLTTPRSPKTGAPWARLWWWIVPVILLTTLFELQFSGMVTRLWGSWFPFLAEPHGFDLGALLSTPAAKAQLLTSCSGTKPSSHIDENNF